MLNDNSAETGTTLEELNETFGGEYKSLDEVASLNFDESTPNQNATAQSPLNWNRSAAGLENGGQEGRNFEFEEFDDLNDNEKQEADDDADAKIKSQSGSQTAKRVSFDDSVTPEKKGFNPRIVKIVSAVALIIVVLGGFYISSRGDSKHSYFKKNKNGNTNDASETATAAGNSENASSGGSGGSGRSQGGLKFGEAPVGSDPRGTTESGEGAATTDQAATAPADKTQTENNSGSDPFSYNGNNQAGNNSASGQDYHGSIAPGVAGGTTAVAGNNQNTANTNDNRSGEKETSSVSANAKQQSNGKRLQPDDGVEAEAGRFGRVMRAGENQMRANNASTVETKPDSGIDSTNPQPTSGNALTLEKGTKIELTLEDPIRSGIASAITAKVQKAVLNRQGGIEIPSQSLVIIPFSAESVNGRVFNEKDKPIQIVTPDGRSYEVRGSVKDARGITGIGGKVTKTNRRNPLGKIAGGALGAIGIGGRIGGGINRGVESINSNPDYVRGASEIVDVGMGTSFQLLIGF